MAWVSVGGFWRFCIVLLLFLAGLGAASSAHLESPAQAVDASCARHDVDVALVEGGLAVHRVAGWLCATQVFDGQPVIIASHPAASDHHYWDWTEDPQRYSFVRAATSAGYAVFNYDRIGVGESDRPEAMFVTLQSGAFVVDQLARMLRAGELGGTAFGSVVLLGNSYGTLISIFAAEVYGTADALVNTGVLVGPHPEGLLDLFAAFHPVQADPKFADEGLPLGYMTTVPGGRGILYHLPAMDAAVLALDEDLKETLTMPEAATFGLWTPATHLVDVPVLSVVGDRDFLFCRPQCAPDGPEMTKEPLFWGPETCFELALLPETGHGIQLHRDGVVAFHSVMLDWLERRVGATAAPASPCAGSATD